MPNYEIDRGIIEISVKTVFKKIKVHHPVSWKPGILFNVWSEINVFQDFL